MPQDRKHKHARIAGNDLGDPLGRAPGRPRKDLGYNDLDGDGAPDLWVGIEARRGDAFSHEWRLVPSGGVLGSEPWMDADDAPQVVAADDYGGVWPEVWVGDQDLDADGLDDLCTVAVSIDAFPMPWAICCVRTGSLGGAPIGVCEDGDGQIGSQSIGVGARLHGVGDLDGDGLGGIAGDGAQQYLFDGDDLLSGGAVEALSVVDVTLDTLYEPRSVTVLPESDGDGGTELLLVHPDNVEHDGTTVEGFATKGLRGEVSVRERLPLLEGSRRDRVDRGRRSRRPGHPRPSDPTPVRREMIQAVPERLGGVPRGARRWPRLGLHARVLGRGLPLDPAHRARGHRFHKG